MLLRIIVPLSVASGEPWKKIIIKPAAAIMMIMIAIPRGRN
ncbi:MAG TPA: hypothetical protein VFY67_20395 [Pyrinomonadaceae bacterium]|nr:hypothetical protein [Pyrinomonadaceae bacterium]